MPVIQNDWLAIKAKFGDRTALYALTTAQASLLLSVAPQLEWRKTYRAFGYDFADWDYLQEEVADLQRGLMMPVYIDDLLTRLDELTDAVFSLYCCPDGTPVDLTEGDQYVDQYTEDEANGIPDNIVSSGYADDDDDWDGFYNYKCMVSHVAIESLAQKLDKFEELSDAATIGILSTGAIVVILGTILGVVSGGTFIIVLAILGGIAAVADMYQELGEAAEGFFSDAATEVRENAEALACALFAGDGPSDSYDKMIVKADAILTAPTAAVIRLMNMKADVKALYSGRYDETNVAQRLADLGYDVISYDCDCPTEPPAEGYEVMIPETHIFMAFNGCTNTGSSYNPVTGLLTIDINVTSSTWEVTQRIFEGPGAGGTFWLVHGYVFHLLSMTSPSSNPRFQGHASGQIVSMPSELPVGKAWAGYNVVNHPGAPGAWEDWAGQYHHVENSDNNTEYLVLGKPTGGGTTGAHLFVLKVKIVVPL
jgi:hypothetical protein